MQQFSGVNLKNIFLNVTEINFGKIIVSFLALTYNYLFQNDASILMIIYLLICIDTITGFWIAYRKRNIKSSAFVRVTMKCFIYFLLIIVGRLVDNVVPVKFAATIMESFLAITEALSILENIGKLGFPVPTKLIKILLIFSEKKHKNKK